MMALALLFYSFASFLAKSLKTTISHCINHVFYFLDSDAFNIQGLADSGGPAPLTISQFLLIVSISQASALFKCRPTNPEPRLQPHPLLGSHILTYYRSTLIIPRPGPKQRKTTPVPWSPSKSFKRSTFSLFT